MPGLGALYKYDALLARLNLTRQSPCVFALKASCLVAPALAAFVAPGNP